MNLVYDRKPNITPKTIGNRVLLYALVKSEAEVTNNKRMRCNVKVNYCARAVCDSTAFCVTHGVHVERIHVSVVFVRRQCGLG